MVFLGGLPRTGSTLLVALLRQAPGVSVTPTGWALEALEGARQAFSQSDTKAAWLNQEEATERMLSASRGFLEGYGATVEKTRLAIPYRQFLRRVMGDDFRVIAPVRDLCGILASMETLYRRNPEASPGPIPSTVEGRVHHWMERGAAPLGLAIHSLYDALQENDTDGVLFIRYEDLVADPMAQLQAIYRWCGWDWDPQFHDPENLNPHSLEHDAVHGIYGDHELKASRVTAAPGDPEAVLGSELCRKVRESNPWFYRTFYADQA